MVRHFPSTLLTIDHANVFPRMPIRLLQAVMNDFFDGETADVAIGLSRKYLNI